ncbi:MAG: hypothetical protein MZW92_76610 [Comamonadaceae bacterium]|nr:hypothetical protein [Comamonadaceae bacterium]
MYSKKRTRDRGTRRARWRWRWPRNSRNQSLPEIGEAFGGRDHTTVLHACRKIAELRETDADIEPRLARSAAGTAQADMAAGRTVDNRA